MSISVTYRSDLSVVETVEGPFVSPVDATFTANGLSTDETLTASTTPPVTKHADYELTLSSGTGSINLAALPGRTSEETVVGTGLKLQHMKLRNKSTNANIITITKGASNGYGLNAAGASWTVVLDPNQEFLFRGNDSTPDVGSGARLMDVTGTGSQVLQVQITLG